MIVVSDTTVLIVLSQMSQLELLPQLFGSVAIPEVVRDEYGKRPDQFGFVELSSLSWLSIRSSLSQGHWPQLDDGEAAAIDLALELKPDFLLMDDRNGRVIAKQLKIPVIGTIGVLERPAQQGIVDLEEQFRLLRLTSFFVSEELLIERLAVFALRKSLKQADS